ncbi:Ig-like domain-containing protein, partial [Pelotomaculum terephthalicicum JT]|uniref:Ig-like domain-containing protein n=1 Tax=Pelotomaculum terephthalicicum TaxID=206393 RepID=UPI001F03EC52
YSSDNTAVATVNSSGTVTAVSAGTANITVTTADGGYTATCAVTVQDVYPATTMWLNKAVDTITAGATDQLTATIGTTGASQNVTWASSNPAVATVSDTGLVTAVAPGTANIIATNADGSLNATCVVTVPPVAVTGVSLDKSSDNIVAGGTDQLTATVAPANATNQNVTWASDNTAVATVSDTGLVTGVAPGTANITVTTADGSFTATCAVTVQATAVGVTGVSLNKSSTTITVGGTDQLTATMTPANATNQNVTWASSDTAVATVSGSGLVTAVAPGSANITVTTADGGFTATCAVTVADENAPAWTSGSVLTATVSGSSVNLSWPAATDNVGVTGYKIKIYQGTTLKTEDTITATSYSVTGVTNGKYTFKVEAVDDGGNWSNNSLDTAIFIAPTTNTTVSGQVYTDPLQEEVSLVAYTILDTGAVQLNVEIPAGVTIYAPEAWDGVIYAPAVKDKSTVTVTPDAGKTVSSVNTVIEVGFSGGTLEFDKAVKILIPGQAGHDVGYFSSDGTFNPIKTVVAATYSDAVTAELANKSAREGKQDEGNALAIWTMHLTKFATYTQTSSGSDDNDDDSDSSGSGGGGGSITPQAVTSTTGSATVYPSAGGTISLGSEAAIVVPAGALTGTRSVKVKVQKVTPPPAVPIGFKLASGVYEFSAGGEYSYNFAKSVTIKLSFDPEAIDAGETPAIYYYDEALAKWVNIGGTVSGNTITVQVDHFTKFAVIAAGEEEAKPIEKPAGSLNDITGHWAMDNINKLVDMGCINGYPDGSFKPDHTITRAEFATMLVKAFKLESQGGKIFADTASHWAKDYLVAAAANGVINGYDNNTFGPDDLITREQMAVMIVKAAKLNMVTEETAFADSGSISGWAGEAMATAAKNGLIKGYPDNTVRPQGNATRAEAVTVILNALNQ